MLPTTSTMTSTKRMRQENEEVRMDSTHAPMQSCSTSSYYAEAAFINSSTGLNITNKHMRSILAHPMGLPLTIYLNDANIPDHPEYVRTVLGKYVRPEDPSLEFANDVFATTALQWSSQRERAFTSLLVDNINSNGIGASLLTTDGKKRINTGISMLLSQVDMMFHDKEKHEDKYSIIAMAEFGLDHDCWWEKMHQNLLFVYILRQIRNGKHQYKMDRPILLPIMTIDASSYNHIEMEGKKNETKAIQLDAKFGLFLCMPKGEKDYRLALLWRKHTKNLHDASMAFGKILMSIQLCAGMRNDQDFNQNTMDYKYLGPNCCMIQGVLYRAYDDWLQCANRHPDLYYSELLFDERCRATTVLKIIDDEPRDDGTRNDDDEEEGIEDNPPVNVPMTKLNIGKEAQSPSPSELVYMQKFDWMWMFQGELLVISIPFHIGLHYATHPYHFFPIIDRLMHLHSHGFVHGDIRGYNMVFDTNCEASKPEGWLIDFDYGGKHNEVLYPKGYVNIMADGDRRGKEHEKITIMDDWKSLYRLILTKYVEVKKEGISLSTDEKSLLFDLRQALSAYNQSDHDDTNVADYQYPATLLRDYLTALGKNYYLKPEYTFKRNLMESGLWTNSDAPTVADATLGATGSLNISPYNHA